MINMLVMSGTIRQRLSVFQTHTRRQARRAPTGDASPMLINAENIVHLPGLQDRLFGRL
jgi:hypothetical protein